MNPLQQALQSLPHGPEFRFLDELIRLDPGQEGVAVYQIRGTEPFLSGHFPGQPMFPGVLLVEAAAQLAGVVAQSDPALKPLTDLRLTAIRSVKILDTGIPGERITIEAKITGRLVGLVQAEVRARVDGRALLEGAVTLAGVPPA